MESSLGADQSQASPATTDDQDILDNIDGRIHGPMVGFMEKNFGNPPYISQSSSSETQVAESASDYDTAPSPDKFLQWFSSYVAQELDGSRGVWHISKDSIASGHEGTEDSARLLLTVSPSLGCDTGTRWDHVQVIGQFYQHCVYYQDGLLSLCRSTHQVFASQPTRLFVHGFYIRSSLIELWVFDRSGLYCSSVFNIQNEFTQFLSIILSYQRIKDEDLGRLDIIKTDMDGSYMMIDGVEIPSSRKIYLESEPVASCEDLIGTGTTCYRVRTPESILKFKWRWARERPENELLELAQKNSVWGAVSLDYYRELESTANLRRGLRWGPQRKFSSLTSPDTRRGADGCSDYTEETRNFFQNRILSCTITSPAGRPLHTFHSLVELLQVFRDAIKCHQSLYNAGILHQDVSSGNMIIMDRQGEGKPKGILIDLDSTIELTKESETEGDIIGTRPFMAIGVLRGERHTYQHDLESFLYVFLWTVISRHTDNPPETSNLWQWSNGDWNELAVRKCIDMGQDRFRNILTEFTPEFYSLQSLAESLRQILFPLEDGVIWTGTYTTPEAIDKLYDGMIDAFERSIASECGR